MDEMRDWVNLSTLPADVWPDVCTLKLPTESHLVFQHFMKSVQMQHSQKMNGSVNSPNHQQHVSVLH